MLRGLVISITGFQEASKVELSANMVWSNLNGGFEMAFGFCQLIATRVCGAEVVVGDWVLRVLLDRSVENVDGFGVFLLFNSGDA